MKSQKMDENTIQIVLRRATIRVLEWGTAPYGVVPHLRNGTTALVANGMIIRASRDYHTWHAHIRVTEDPMGRGGWHNKVEFRCEDPENKDFSGEWCATQSAAYNSASHTNKGSNGGIVFGVGYPAFQQVFEKKHGEHIAAFKMFIIQQVKRGECHNKRRREGRESMEVKKKMMRVSTPGQRSPMHNYALLIASQDLK
jgi:hypothetical protein